MKKKILSMALALCLAFGSAAALPEGVFETSTNITASAWGEQEYTYGDYKYVVQDDGSIKITDYSGIKRKVSIPSKINNRRVTVIGSKAFANCKSIDKLTIPSTVNRLNSGAFQGCTSLTSITIPSTVKTVEDTDWAGGGVFEGCTALETATLNNNAVAEDMFNGCTALKSVKIGSNIKTIGKKAFYNCQSLEKINIPNTVESVGYCAYKGCISAESITIGDGVTTISNMAFMNCKSAESVKFGKKVNFIGSGAFRDCISLISVVVPATVTDVGYNDYDGEGVFQNCSSLEKADVNSSIIASQMFYNCTSLKSVTIGSKVRSIGRKAFTSCSSLTSLKIPDNVEVVGVAAFSHCTKLKTATIGNGAGEIDADAFYNCSNLKSVSIGNNVSFIGYGAFAKCISLTSVTIPASVAEVTYNEYDGGGAFEGCTSLKTAIIKGKTIGEYMFAGCESLSKVTIYDGVTDIGEAAFWKCASLPRIIVPGSVKTVGAYAFKNCGSLKEAFLLDGVVTVSEQAFQNCTSLGYVYISNKAVTIENNAFCNVGANSIVCPKNVKTIGEGAFGYTEYYWGGKTLKDGFVLYCYKTPIFAKEYAENYNVKYKLVDNCKHGTYKSITVAPTCKKQGYTLKFCTKCGKTTKTNYKPAVKHSYGNWSVTKNATCTAKGEKVRFCKLCGKKETGTIAALGHKHANNWRTVSFNFANKTSVIKDSCKVCGKLVFSRTVESAIRRYAGANRFDTAAKLSKGMYTKADTVIITTGTDFHDALVAVPLAQAYSAPLLLATEKHITDQTLAELKRLKAKNVIVISTNGAIGAKAKAELKGYNTTYITGKNDYETAANVAKALQKKKGKAPTTIFFATAGSYADALSASPIAAVKGAPIIYLKNKGSIDAATAKYLKSVKGKVKNAYVIGGAGVISDAMMKNVAAALGLKSGKTVVRVAGANRYETCVAVNNKFKSTLSGTGVCVAKGLDFPDALAGGVFAAKNKVPLFLADGKKLQDYQSKYLKTKNARMVYISGGTGAVSDDMVKLVCKASV